jgi:hypothetical protein
MTTGSVKHWAKRPIRRKGRKSKIKQVDRKHKKTPEGYGEDGMATVSNITTVANTEVVVKPTDIMVVTGLDCKTRVDIIALQKNISDYYDMIFNPKFTSFIDFGSLELREEIRAIILNNNTDLNLARLPIAPKPGFRSRSWAEINTRFNGSSTVPRQKDRKQILDSYNNSVEDPVKFKQTLYPDINMFFCNPNEPQFEIEADACFGTGSLQTLETGTPSTTNGWGLTPTKYAGIGGHTTAVSTHGLMLIPTRRSGKFRHPDKNGDEGPFYVTEGIAYHQPVPHPESFHWKLDLLHLNEEGDGPTIKYNIGCETNVPQEIIPQNIQFITTVKHQTDVDKMFWIKSTVPSYKIIKENRTARTVDSPTAATTTATLFTLQRKNLRLSYNVTYPDPEIAKLINEKYNVSNESRCTPVNRKNHTKFWQPR